MEETYPATGKLTGYGIAMREGISCVSRLASAERGVVAHVASGESAADAGAGIDALVTHTSLVETTFGGHRALRPTAGRTTNVLRKAGAGSHTILFATLRVWSAGRGLAWVNVLPDSWKVMEEMYDLVRAMGSDMLTFRFDVAITVGVAHIAAAAVAGG